MDIEEVDARTAPDEVLARFHALEVACHDELRPGEPPHSVSEAVAFYRHVPATDTRCHWLTEGGGASIVVHGPRATFLQLLVDPARRRRGIGSALLEWVLDRCRELDIEAVRGVHTTPAAAAFAARFGAVDEQRVVRSLLDLRTADLPEPRVSEGFRIITWLGRVPDEYLAAYVRGRVAMDDAPAPEEMELPAWTAEKARATEESLERRDRELRVTAALDAENDVVAFTDLRVSRGSTLGFTDDTGTVAAERGKGLARAVKLESLRRLRDDHPEIEVVSTSNAEENAVMRHINESIGFRPTLVETLAALEVRPPGSVDGNPR
jgi:mycothiol synthase